MSRQIPEKLNIITNGNKWPEHKDTRTGDIFIDELNLKTTIAVSYDKIGSRWVDASNPSKILARNSDFEKNPVIEDFQYKNNLHSKLFWEVVDSESTYVDIADHDLKFRFSDEKTNAFVFDLGKIVSTQWKLRFGLNISYLNPPREGIFKCFFGLSSHDQNTPAKSHQDFIGIALTLAIVEKKTSNQILRSVSPGLLYKGYEIVKVPEFKIGVLDTASETLNKNITTFLSHNLTTEKLLIEIEFNESDYVISIFSDSNYTKLIEKIPIKCNIPPKNLRYICAKNQFEQRNGACISGSIEAVRFYNGGIDRK